jgi:hypothetical protein
MQRMFLSRARYEHLGQTHCAFLRERNQSPNNIRTTPMRKKASAAPVQINAVVQNGSYRVVICWTNGVPQRLQILGRAARLSRGFTGRIL